LNKRNIIVGIAVFFSVLLLGIVIYSNEGPQNSLPNPSNTPTPTWPSFPNSKTIEVPEDYSTISLAVNASNAGDTILVKEGTYVESVTVDKSLIIRGENKETTIVDGNNMGPTFLIKSDYVRITGFKIRNVENPPPVSDSRARLAGVHLLDAHGCDISENVAVNCGKGVWVYGGSGNTVSNNILSGNNYGILIQSSTDNSVTGNNASNGWGGIWLDSSSGNKLRNNNMLNNARSFGVSGGELYQFVNDVDLSNMVNDKKVYYLLDDESLTIDPVSFPDLGALVLVNCRDVTVQNLEMQNNYVGIHVIGAVNSTVTHNAVGSNTVGIWLQFSSDCVISKNDVKQNTDCGVRVDGSNSILVLENNVEQNEHESRLIMMLSSSNCTIAENTLENRLYYTLSTGIYLESSNYTNIINNYQSGTDGTIYGIILKSSSNNLIQSNTFTNCVPGVWIRDGSNYNRVIGNSFSTERGSMGVALAESYFNNLSENIIYNFSAGFELSNAENNIIARNIVTSRDYAVKLFRFNNNIFEGNQFLGSASIWDMGADMGTPSTNIWK
jgi:parallel beta-helix repeat protein